MESLTALPIKYTTIKRLSYASRNNSEYTYTVKYNKRNKKYYIYRHQIIQKSKQPVDYQAVELKKPFISSQEYNLRPILYQQYSAIEIKIFNNLLEDIRPNVCRIKDMHLHINHALAVELWKSGRKNRKLQKILMLFLWLEVLLNLNGQQIAQEIIDFIKKNEFELNIYENIKKQVYNSTNLQDITYQ